MSAKLQYRPAAIDRSPVTNNAPIDGAELVLSGIRKVQVDAEQICNDTADIEDARYLAENIVDTCRRILAIGNGTTANAHPIDCMPAERPVPAVLASAGNPDTSREAAARAKLDSLSARELNIFTHLAEGRSAAEIGVKLSRSCKTINNHRTRILQKLGLKNATELVRLALQSGLVSI
jgi:DNA-binding CsgD family transcriptional regulator